MRFRKHSFLHYILTPRTVAVLLLVFVVSAATVGMCKLSGYWFLADPIMYAFAIFCTAYILKHFIDWLKYRSK